MVLRLSRARPTFARARSHLLTVLGWGAAVGLLLGLSVVVVARWGRFWFVLGRVGVLMLESHTFFVLSVIFFAVGATLQAGATGAVKTVKMGAKLLPVASRPAGNGRWGDAHPPCALISQASASR